MNFHKDLLAMGQEVHYWERLRMPIPYIAMEINAQRDKYRVLRDSILMVCPSCCVCACLPALVAVRPQSGQIYC